MPVVHTVLCGLWLVWVISAGWVTAAGTVQPRPSDLTELSLEELMHIEGVWLFFDDVHVMISKCGARLGRCVWSG